MDRLLTCAACGYVGHDVRIRVVYAPEPIASMAVAHADGSSYHVPEVYVREPRCVDRDACRERRETAA